MEIIDLKGKLDILSSESKSDWEVKAKNRLANKSWLKHSRKIAVKINFFLKSNKMTQKDLAKLLGVSPQQVSKIIKGRENLTLETISNIENVLKIKLLVYDEIENNFEDKLPVSMELLQTLIGSDLGDSFSKLSLTIEELEKRSRERPEKLSKLNYKFKK